MSRRVLFVITDSGVGGAEKALLAVLKGLDRSRYEPCGVMVVKGQREMAAKWAATGVPVRSFGMGRLPNPLRMSTLSAAIHGARPDVVHAWMYHSIQYARLAGRGAPWRLVTSPRVSYRHFPFPALWIDSALRRPGELAVSESEAGRRELIDRGYPPAAVRVAPNGVDADAYRRNEEARARLRAEWGVREGELVVGAAGRLNRQKGFDLLLDAAAELKSHRTPFRIVIAGEGPEAGFLRATASRLNVRATLLGRRDDMPAVLSAFDIFAQSSRFEGLSNALLESMAAGLPCVATAVDGTLDFARDGENLLLVKPEAPTSLAVGIGYLLEKPALRARLGENATITARQNTVERMVRAFESAYDAACDASTAQHNEDQDARSVS